MVQPVRRQPPEAAARAAAVHVTPSGPRATADPPQPRQMQALRPTFMPSGTPYVYVSGGGPDITYFKLGLATGALAKQGSASGGINPSYLAVAPDKHHLYAVNEAAGTGSQVIAFSIDGSTGPLTEIDRAPTSGDGAPHLAVHPSGKWLAVAHYRTSGHTSILPIRADGTSTRRRSSSAAPPTIASTPIRPCSTRRRVPLRTVPR